MGMFDTVDIPIDFLPLEKCNLKFVNQLGHWQTKSMENLMVTYTITPYKELWLLDGDWESVPTEERPYPNDNGIKGLMGSMRVIRSRHEKLEYTGTINFYTSVGRHDDYQWFEFDAVFEYGKLLHIQSIQQPGEFIDPEIVKTFS